MFGNGRGWDLLHQLLVAWQQHPAVGEFAANARPGYVILVGGFSWLYYYRRTHRRLVCRSRRSALGLALGGLAALVAAALGAVTLRNVQTGKMIMDGPEKKSA